MPQTDKVAAWIDSTKGLLQTLAVASRLHDEVEAAKRLFPDVLCIAANSRYLGKSEVLHAIHLVWKDVNYNYFGEFF